MKIGFWGLGGRQGLMKPKMTLENDHELLFPYLHLLSAKITNIPHFAWVYTALSIKPRAPHLLGRLLYQLRDLQTIYS